MLRLSDDRPRFRESVLLPDRFEMSEERTEVEQLLDDERFLAPIKERFSTLIGRPMVPVAIYSRMIYLKHRDELGYETLINKTPGSDIYFPWLEGTPQLQSRYCSLMVLAR